MDKNWASVGLAALFEVGWVIGMKHAEGVLEIGGTVIAIIVSFYLMIRASRALPVGTVYAVFVGLGTAGTVVAELVLFDAPANVLKILLIGTLLAGVTGLKLLSPKTKKEAG
ncbi:multidrug efflux SMR transporter [Paenibacillus sp. YN15]|uniref:DMT family transporter n=1 Tax=Paenibacillus sp. YN15 TaxID=1742774 RepID=UPI000DCE7AA9|nr:multidrug efflux SMR transporter [Paenibacillus sp. YN15]RAV01984.1 QacE family quaternary ammonium compound efflux SMR transporter [Paenibacillus sp. YN15]